MQQTYNPDTSPTVMLTFAVPVSAIGDDVTSSIDDRYTSLCLDPPRTAGARQRSYQLSSQLLEQMTFDYGIVCLSLTKKVKNKGYANAYPLFLAPPAGLEPATS